jgi:hypothetical protein
LIHKQISFGHLIISTIFLFCCGCLELSIYTVS